MIPFVKGVGIGVAVMVGICTPVVFRTMGSTIVVTGISVQEFVYTCLNNWLRDSNAVLHFLQERSGTLGPATRYPSSSGS